MKRRIFCAVLLVSLIASGVLFWSAPVVYAAPGRAIVPGDVWRDTSGNVIQAHGVGMIQVGNTYYWFGEDRSQDRAFANVKVYASTDLVNWTFRNNALTQQSSGDLSANRVVERPKVIYNAATNTYVMYMHIDDSSYGEAKVGVATSSTVDGTYTYRGSFRPLGTESRDMTLFQDTDGSAYLIHSANNNNDLHIDKLAADYLSVASNVKVFAGVRWESPAMFKRNGLYYLVSSAPTGWTPNANKYVTSTSLGGTWSAAASLAPGSNTTYASQSASILPVYGSKATTYVYMGDRWASSELGNSRYIWMPLTFTGSAISLPRFYESWSIDPVTGVWSVAPTSSYEAEAGGNTLAGGAVTASCGNCAGGQKVGYVGNNSGTLQFNNVQASAGGGYTLTIYYANGDTGAREASMSVNGGAATTVRFPSTYGGNNVSSMAVTVSLNAGNNTIKFSNSTGWAPDFDKIGVTGAGKAVDDSVQGSGGNQFHYVGSGWGHCTGCGGEMYGGSNSWSAQGNDYVTVTFTGRQIDLYAVSDPKHGIVAVSLDGGGESNVDLYAVNRGGNQLVWSSGNLSAGTHTLKVRVTGSKNASSGGTYVAVDRVDVFV